MTRDDNAAQFVDAYTRLQDALTQGKTELAELAQKLGKASYDMDRVDRRDKRLNEEIDSLRNDLVAMFIERPLVVEAWSFCIHRPEVTTADCRAAAIRTATSTAKGRGLHQLEKDLMSVDGAPVFAVMKRVEVRVQGVEVIEWREQLESKNQEVRVRAVLALALRPDSLMEPFTGNK